MDTTAIKSLKPLLSMLVVLAAALPGAVDAASDARFFGTYCGTHRVWVDVPGKDQSYDLDIEAYANHYEPRPGQGVVTGRGVAIAKNVGWKLRKDDEDDQGIAEGQRFPFVFSGLVKQRGVLKGSARVAGIEPGSADAFLDEDGETITMEAFDFGEIELSKARCGNTRPSAGIRNPAADGAIYPWGKLNSLYGWATDAEDEATEMHMVWTSSRDPDWRQEGIGRTSAHIEQLATGIHKITFTVIDSGGRSASVERLITIENDRPRVPKIYEPLADAHFTAGQCLPFRGEASDPEDGNLTGNALVWTSNLVTRPLGVGDNFVCRSPQCALKQGRHTITLTATDGAGASRSTSVPIIIEPRTAANSAPSVWLRQPANWSVWDAGISPDEEADRAYTRTITLEAGFCDLEDETLNEEQFTWTVNELVLRDGTIFETIPIDLGVDEDGNDLQHGSTTHWTLDPARYSIDTRHEVTVTVTDNDGGSTTSEPVYIIVLPGIGLY